MEELETLESEFFYLENQILSSKNFHFEIYSVGSKGEPGQMGTQVFSF